MKYQFRDKKGIERKKRLIKVAIISSVIFLIFLTGLVSFSGGFFNFLGKPLWKIRNTVSSGISSSEYLVRTKKSVFTENEELNRRLVEQNLAMTDYQILKKDNEELKSLLGRVTTKNTFILANILVKPNQSPYDTLIIDVGSDVGLKEGDKVFANEVIPLGYISHVYDHTSLVSLYSNPGETTEAMIIGSNATVELVGRGGGNFEMTVPIDLESSKGTMVVFPGLSSEVVAIMDDVISNPTDPVKKVLLRSPANIQQLKWVEIQR
jgi:rod shape-determining protein MreC